MSEITRTIEPAVAKRIKLVVFDVDGVLTDGGIYIGAVDGTPMEFKRYDIQDGVGIHFLRMAGLKVAIITGRVSESVRIRAGELEVDHLVQDAGARKLPAFRRILESEGLTEDEVAFVGDDYPDMGVLRVAGMPVAVGNAVPEVKAIAKVVLERSGGRGAVREFVELLLKARDAWTDVTERYVAERSRDDADVAAA